LAIIYNQGYINPVYSLFLVDLFLHKQYKENIELWDWAGYKKFSAIINGYEPEELKEIK
jgi:hypothetical protein